MSVAVTVWWSSLCAVSALNVVGWLVSLRHFRRNRDRDVARWPHLMLSAVYVLGCAFRSLLPRADVQRIVLYDSFLSSVLVGRSVATLAELCFVAQWALLLHELSRAHGSRFGERLSYAIVPIITLAEVCSWYAVLSTNYLGNALEQSLWTLTAALVALALLGQWRRARGRLRPFLCVTMVLCAGFVLFMGMVDVPMYLARFRADAAAGRVYLTLGEGLRDVSQRWVVTRSWIDWHEEMAWMSLYFSLAVWLSIALAHAPRAEPVRRLTALRSSARDRHHAPAVR